MIFRRFANALRQQDWATATIEFLIVVLGIFVALQVDSWQKGLEDRRLEDSYTGRLRDDLRQDIETFDLEIGQLERKADFIQDLLDKSITQQFAEAPRQVMENKVISSFRGVPAIKRTTFNELMSTGHLALISDTALRSELAEYYTNYASFEQQVNLFDISDYPALVNGYVPGRVAREWRLENTISEPETFVRSLEALGEDPNLPAAANSEITYAAAVQFYLTNYAERAQELLNRLAIVSSSGRGDE